MYDCSVNGHVYRKYRGKRPLWALSDDRPVSKGYGLRFRAQTNTPPPFDVQWQVTNTGREASDDHGLRGDFYVSDDGSMGRWESTRYAGTHWVEAFVVKNGVCLARSGRKLVKIKS
jgi:Adenylyl/Guanylyl and SMODS C-terminal sensor domain